VDSGGEGVVGVAGRCVEVNATEVRDWSLLGGEEAGSESVGGGGTSNAAEEVDSARSPAGEPLSDVCAK
jgi:hypothetical protein